MNMNGKSIEKAIRMQDNGSNQKSNLRRRGAVRRQTNQLEVSGRVEVNTRNTCLHDSNQQIAWKRVGQSSDFGRERL
jgi:hypothetical protein